MVREDGIVKVLDFGLAKLTEKGKTDPEASTLVRTDEGIVMGTAQYMSPEQARGLKVDARTDIWSLGCVLYEMMAGYPPFTGETATDVILSIIEREPAPLVRYSPEVPTELDWIVKKALRKDREERYQTAKELLTDLKSLKQRLEFEAALERSVQPEASGKAAVSGPLAAGTVSHPTPQTERVEAAQPTSSAEYIVTEIKRHKRGAIITLATVALVAVAVFLFYSNRAPALTERDTILLADFVNTTGDAVFDSTLKQALAIQLEQTPFLNIFPEQRVRETLRLMNRSPDERVTREVAREICERQGIKAMLLGSISSLGSHYVITLEAADARTGDTLAREQVEAGSKEQVLRVLGEAATRLRVKLGESLASIQRFDAPLEQATTSSLEALRAYSLGIAQGSRGNFLEAIPFNKRAVELDPNFALAHRFLAVTYSNMGIEPDLARQHMTRAFELRDRVTEREKLLITSTYHMIVTEDFDKRIETLEIFRQTYPRDVPARNLLAFAYILTGEYERAIQEASEGVRINPDVAVLYSNLGWAFRALGRYDEAKAVFEQAHARNLDYFMIHWNLYLIAFAEGDQAAMQRQREWMSGKPLEHLFLSFGHSPTEMFAGRFRQAQEITRRAIQSAQSRNLSEEAAETAALAASWQALAGNCQEAKAETANALALARGGAPPAGAPLALALCGEAARAQSLLDELARRKPTSTEINNIWLPVVRAAIETNRGNPAQAIQFLQVTRRYEMGQIAEFWPIYIRGQAYLRQGSATEAMAEFQRVIDRRSVSPAHILYPLSHLGLARAAALAGETAKARSAYQDFFALWREADPDLPILQQARREYESLG